MFFTSSRAAAFGRRQRRLRAAASGRPRRRHPGAESSQIASTYRGPRRPHHPERCSHRLQRGTSRRVDRRPAHGVARGGPRSGVPPRISADTGPYAPADDRRLGRGIAAGMVRPARLSLSSDLWMIWLEIAIEHARATNEARVRVEDAPPTSALAEALKEELKAALLTMTTSAFAVDAWYGTVRPMIAPRPQLSDRAPRSAWILETLKAGFRLEPAASSRGKPTKALFQHRNPAVHHESILGPPQAHPSGRSHVAAENATYTAGAAVAAADFALEVVTTCLETPRPELRDLVLALVSLVLVRQRG